MSNTLSDIPQDRMRANRGQNMAALIEEENLDEDGKPTKCRTSSRRKSKRKVKSRKSTAASTIVIGDEDEDKDDGNYSASDSGDQSDSTSESDHGESDVEMVSNDEVCIDMAYNLT
ncbi:hypothetical protein JOM56_014943 [Amanita muscaria]